MVTSPLIAYIAVLTAALLLQVFLASRRLSMVGFALTMLLAIFTGAFVVFAYLRSLPEELIAARDPVVQAGFLSILGIMLLFPMLNLGVASAHRPYDRLRVTLPLRDSVLMSVRAIALVLGGAAAGYLAAWMQAGFKAVPLEDAAWMPLVGMALSLFVIGFLARRSPSAV